MPINNNINRTTTVPTQTNFSFPRTSAVLLDNGRHELIRKRESFKDIVAQDFLERDEKLSKE